MKSINPATGDLIKMYRPHDQMQCAEIIDQAHQCYDNWRKTSFQDRASKLNKAADLLVKNKNQYAHLMQEEMGKPLEQGLGEIEKCAWVCRYYAENAEKFLSPESITSDFKKSTVYFEPIGVVLAIMPWNFPFWQVFRFAAPTLMAGNVGILKHASNVSGCSLAIEDIFKQAGFGPGVFTSVLVPGTETEGLIRNPKVRAITLTGSTAAGKSVGRIAGEELKKTVLELGGSDPYLILEDADLDLAAKACAQGRLLNAGQSCISAKRFIVDRKCLQAFEKLLVKNMLMHPEIGPLARKDLRVELMSQVEVSVDQGAKVIMGGVVPPGPGAYYPPTVLTNVTKGMPAYDQELFGPVAAIIPVENTQEAIAVANDSIYGLGGAVFSRDEQKAEQIASKEIDTGNCFVNDFVKSDPRLPFGGVKQSGHGRELSHFGIKEFVNIKTVCIGTN